jgi:hypothetical protein
LAGLASAQEKSIVVASTTEAQDSGLFGKLLPVSHRNPALPYRWCLQAPVERLMLAGAAKSMLYLCIQSWLS